jgi:hypothetical protein
MTTDPSPAAPSATAAPVIPLAFAKRVGGPWWRRQHGLLTWRELAREYAERRFIRPGALVPLPEDLIPGWRRTPC